MGKKNGEAGVVGEPGSVGCIPKDQCGWDWQAFRVGSCWLPDHPQTQQDAGTHRVMLDLPHPHLCLSALPGQAALGMTKGSFSFQSLPLADR